MRFSLFRGILLLAVGIFLSSFGNAQEKSPPTGDTLSLILRDAEQEFLTQNFELLAARYNVSAAEAAIIQARLWDNPTLSVDQGAYNKVTKKWFDISPGGQTAASLEQVIVLGGKRGKRIDIETINTQISQYQFYDLIRTLRHELRTSFFSLHFLRQSLSVYDMEIESLKKLIEAYTIQYKNGNIPFKELARLQALQFSLENERLELLKDASEKQSALVLLTGDTLSRPIQPVVDANALRGMDVNGLEYARLIDSALVHRHDVRMKAAQVELHEADLALQKALRIPDVTLGANWDRSGSYVQDYNSISLKVDIPIFNLNQGNIESAEYRIRESKQLLKHAELDLKNDVSRSLMQLQEVDRLYKSTSEEFGPAYARLIDGIARGYQTRAISLLEFIDFYETYKNSQIEFYRLQNKRIEALEDLNLATGKIWFNY